MMDLTLEVRMFWCLVKQEGEGFGGAEAEDSSSFFCGLFCRTTVYTAISLLY